MRVLTLCGYAQNQYIFKQHLSSLISSCPDIEFVFLDPPYIVQKITTPLSTRDLNGGRSPFEDDSEEDHQDPETVARTWFFSKNGFRDSWSGYEESMAYVHKFVLDNGPFDGVFAFSSACPIAAVLSCLAERPFLHPSFRTNPIPPFKFSILCSGFFVEPSEWISYFPLQTPALVIIGENDTVCSEKRTLDLANQCANVRVEHHTGGHFVPKKANWRRFFRAYINSFHPGGAQGEVPAPVWYCDPYSSSSLGSPTTSEEDTEVAYRRWTIAPGSIQKRLVDWLEKEREREREVEEDVALEDDFEASGSGSASASESESEKKVSGEVEEKESGDTAEGGLTMGLEVEMDMEQVERKVKETVGCPVCGCICCALSA